MAKQSICLCMIVKNEAPVIRRCLDSVRAIIDHWIIVDTGSTDGTQEIIRDHLRDLPGELHERPWRDFAHNRTEALEFARDRADYTLIIDADDALEIQPGLSVPALTADSYTLDIHDTSINYQRTQLVRSALPWRYEGVLHEYLTCDGAGPAGHLDGVAMRRNHDGARRRDPETYLRDARMLEAALADNPTDFLRSRYTFYLAQSYRDCGETQKALELYLKRADLDFWQEEVFISLYQAALLTERLNRSGHEIIGMFLRAWEAGPHRAEALHAAARYCRVNGKFQQGFMFANHAIGIQQPDNGLFIESWIYEYGLLDELAVNGYWAGRFRECLHACERLLHEGKMPVDMQERIEANANFARDKLGISKPLPATTNAQSNWVPERPAGGTELMMEGLRSRLGSELDRIDLRNNHPGTERDGRPVVVWIQHDSNQEYMKWCRDKAMVAAVDRFVFVSEWQRDKYIVDFGIPRDRCVVLRNMTEVPPKRRVWQPSSVWRCAYASTPFRGLSVLLDAWELLKPEKAELHIWSSMKIYRHDDTPYRHLFERAKSLPSIVYHGIVPNEELRRALQNIDFLTYPCTFAETSCIAAIEAMSAGCRLIIPDHGALPETSAGFARRYPWNPDPKAHAETFADVLADEMQLPWGGNTELCEAQQRYCANAYDWMPRLRQWRDLIASLCGDTITIAPEHPSAESSHRHDALDAVSTTAMAQAAPVPDALYYRFNGGGLNNQKLALLGLFLKARRHRVSRVILPEIRSFDHGAFNHSSLPFDHIFQLTPIRDFAKRHGIEIINAPPRGDEGAWGYFQEGQHHLPYAALLGELTVGGFACDFFRSLMPSEDVSAVIRRLKHTVFQEQKILVAVQLRVEKDWAAHANSWLPQWLGPTLDGAEDNSPPISEIFRKISNQLDLPIGTQVYIACDENSLSISREDIRAQIKREFGIELKWKSDFIVTDVFDTLSAVMLSLLDFEVCVTADCFIGLSRSSFSNMIALEKYARTGLPVRSHFIYNLSGSELGLRSDNGAFEPPTMATAVDPWDRVYSQHLARIFINANDTDRAIEHFPVIAGSEKTAREEVYLQLYSNAQTKERLKFTPRDVIDAYLQAADVLPSRAEAPHGASRYARGKEMFEEGYKIAKAAVRLVAPQSDMIAEDWVYDYGLLDELAVNAYWSGHPWECIDACERLLQEDRMPQEIRTRMVANLAAARWSLSPSGCRTNSAPESEPLQFNICRVTFNEHNMFEYIVRALHCSLIELGYICSITENELRLNAVNIVIGAVVWRARHEMLDFLKDAQFILYQFEQLYDDLGLIAEVPQYASLLHSSSVIMEYSPSNLNYLRSLGLENKTVYLPPLYHPCMELFTPVEEPDIDVVFVGGYSERRNGILSKLRESGLNVVYAFNVYGNELVSCLRRAKIVLNIHSSDGFFVLETLRISFALANGCFVVSEIGDHNPYGDGVVYAHYDSLVPTCIEYLSRGVEHRNIVAARGSANYKRTDLTSSLMQVITSRSVRDLILKETPQDKNLMPTLRPIVTFFGDGELVFGPALTRFCTEFPELAMRETELCQLTVREQGDKGGQGAWHNYTILYDHLFSESRQAIRNLFELGIGRGSSLRAWVSYFPNANIVGADIQKSSLFTATRISTFEVDQLDENSIRALWENFSDVDFDIIIEDGIHTFEGSATFLINSLNKVNKSGFFIIEDIVCDEGNLRRFGTLLSTLRADGFLIQLPYSRTPFNDNCVAVLRPLR